MGRLLGKNIALYTEVNGVRRVVGLSTSCTVDLNTDMVELASLAGTCRNYRPGKSGGTIGVERLLDVSGMSLMYMQVQRMRLKYVVEVDGMTLSGDAYISGQSAAAPVQGYATHRVTLTMTGEIGVDVGYITFADAEVGRLCVSAFGDGIGLTKAAAAEVKDIGTVFKGNTLITSFDEFGLFGVEILKQYAFANCTRLSSIVVPDSVRILQEYAMYKAGIVSLTAKATNLYGWAVGECPSLTTVELPEVVSLGGYSFYKCILLNTVRLGANVRSIGAKSFSGCLALRYLYIDSPVPPALTHENALEGTNDSMVIYVPKGSLSAYQNDTNWDTYANRLREQ